MLKLVIVFPSVYRFEWKTINKTVNPVYEKWMKRLLQIKKI